MGTLLAGGAAAAAAVYGAHQLSHGAHHLGHGGHHGFGHGKFKHGKFKHGKFGKRWKHGGFGKHKFKRWKWYGLKAYVMVWAKGFNFRYWTGKRLQHCHSSITINEFWMIFFFFEFVSLVKMSQLLFMWLRLLFFSIKICKCVSWKKKVQFGNWIFRYLGKASIAAGLSCSPNFLKRKI